MNRKQRQRFWEVVFWLRLLLALGVLLWYVSMRIFDDPYTTKAQQKQSQTEQQQESEWEPPTFTEL
jgi:hypothetical protein